MRDGLKAADFHTRCDGIANTLTVVKANSGNIFGGYTEQAWHSKNEWNSWIIEICNSWIIYVWTIIWRR
jgi:hypothetical protein